jgi:TM2 domain-containing membrane protein YozV
MTMSPGRDRRRYKPKAVVSDPMTAYRGTHSPNVARPGLAALLSLVVPGLGLLYCGRLRAGLLTLLLLTPALILMVVLAAKLGQIGLLAALGVALVVDIGQAVMTHRLAGRLAKAA